MRRRLLFFVLGMACLMAAIGLAADDEKPDQRARPRIGVFPFDDQSRSGGGLGDIVCEQFSTELVKTGRFDVYERRKIEDIAKEHGIQMSGMTDERTAVRVGKLAGCQLISYGTVMDASCKTSSSTDKKGRTSYTTTAEVTVNYKIVDAEDGRVWQASSVTKTESESGHGDQASLIRRAAIRTAGTFAARVYPLLKAKVIKVTEQGAIVDIGSQHGLVASYELSILVAGDAGDDVEVIDPATGEVIGKELGSGKATILLHPVQIQAKMCYAMPGYWKKVKRILWSEWEWRPDAALLKDIKPGDEVTGSGTMH